MYGALDMAAFQAKERSRNASEASQASKEEKKKMVLHYFNCVKCNAHVMVRKFY